jgi:hypothetical protein
MRHVVSSRCIRTTRDLWSHPDESEPCETWSHPDGHPNALEPYETWTHPDTSEPCETWSHPNASEPWDVVPSRCIRTTWDLWCHPDASEPRESGLIPMHQNHVRHGLIPMHQNHVRRGLIPMYQNHVRRGLIPTHQNQSQKGSTCALKLMTTKSQSPKHQQSAVLTRVTNSYAWICWRIEQFRLYRIKQYND